MNCMLRTPIRLSRRHLIAMAAALPARSVFAETFPARPVKLIVPFAPGGATDAFARTVAAGLSERWGQQVLVDNRAGAGGNIGAELAARAPADGHTLLMATSNHAVNATLYPKLGYDLLRDFAPLTNVAQVPLVVVVGSAAAARSLAELVATAKAKPRSLRFASGGSGTASHLTGEMFADTIGAELVHVPYKGGAPALNDLLGGHVDLMFANLPEALPHLRGGRLRALAQTGAKRHAALPSLPTLAEAGIMVEAASWFCLFAPAATPVANIARLHEDIVAVLRQPAVRARLVEQGADVVADAPAAFATHVRDEIGKWGRLVKLSGATTD